MPTTLETVASYVPAAVARHHGASAPAPDQPSRRPLRAALLFANISGFTTYALRDRPAVAAAFDEALRIATEIGATPLALRHPASNNDAAPVLRHRRGCGLAQDDNRSYEIVA